MKRKPNKNIEKEVDKAQDKVEKIELKNIQKDYETKIPVFIWFLKIIIILVIILSVINIFISFLVLKSIFLIIIYSILLLGIIKRKRWALYLGLVFFTINTILTLIYEGPISLPLHLIMLGLLYWHRDYFSK